MLRKCGSGDMELLTDYLSLEKEYNTFLLADLAAYGFHSECQDVWMDQEDGRCMGVYLRYYTNLLVYSRENLTGSQSLEYILQNHDIFVIMGKSSIFSQIRKNLDERYRFCQKELYGFGGPGSVERLKPESDDVKEAGLQDVDQIYGFLGSIPEISGLYTSKDMIKDRIASGDGVHLGIWKDGLLISHGNTTTGSDYTVMIGGVATSEPDRRKGLASHVVSALCRSILSQGKSPCLFAGRETAAFFTGLGFKKLGGYATLERI